MTAIYRGIDRAALDAAYDNAAVVADSQTYRAKWWDRSAEPASRLGLRYSERPRATLDYFPAQADAPSAPTLRRQSEEYVQTLRARNLPATLKLLPGHNHFSIMEELARPDDALTQGLLELIANRGADS